MRLLNNQSFKKKLILLVALPLIASLYFSIAKLNDLTSRQGQLSQIQSLSSLTVANNALVHELQKERGATAVFLGSQGKSFKAELQNQRKNTDKALAQLEAISSNFHSDYPSVNTIVSDINNSLSKLMATRKSIDSLSIALGDAIQYYTSQNNKMLSLTGFFSTISPTETVTNAIAYYNLLEAKERAGIERAIASGGFAKDSFTQASFQKFISLVALQSSFLEQFTIKASADGIESYKKSLTNPAVLKVNEMRNTINSVGQNGPFKVDASIWFKNATVRINLLKEIENLLAQEFIDKIDTLYNEAKSAVFINIFIILFVFLLTAGVVYIILSNLLKQLKELSNTIDKVSENLDLTAKTKVLSSDELGEVATGLNKVLNTFSLAISEIKSSSFSLSSSAEQSATIINKNVESLQAQRDETSQVASAVEEMSATTQEVSRNANEAMKSTHEVNSKTIESQATVSNSLAEINQLVSEVSEVKSMITGLHNTTSNITQVIDVIKGIAEQTNLLALNAAIEAARAGEQGRGFAVVADEVRTLAQRTQDSTIEIEEIINKLQGEANTANNKVTDTQQRANDSMEGAHKIEEALASIVTSVSSVNLMIEQIAETAQDQVKVTEEINHNVNDIDMKSEHVTEGAQEVSTVADEQANIANNLKQLTEKFIA